MIPKSAGSRSSLEMRIPCNLHWVLYSSGFFVIRAICSYHKYIYCTIGAREFSLIRTNTYESQNCKKL